MIFSKRNIKSERGRERKIEKSVIFLPVNIHRVLCGKDGVFFLSTTDISKRDIKCERERERQKREKDNLTREYPPRTAWERRSIRPVRLCPAQISQGRDKEREREKEKESDILKARYKE